MEDKVRYYDKHGNEIKAGDIIRHVDGTLEEVYDNGEGDLGLNASNEEYMKAHGLTCRELYPLYQFDTEKEWEIVSDAK